MESYAAEHRTVAYLCYLLAISFYLLRLRSRNVAILSGTFFSVQHLQLKKHVGISLYSDIAMCRCVYGWCVQRDSVH